MVLQAIIYSRSSLQILNQLELPHTQSYIEILSAEQAWQSIKSMQVRGAPAIAIVAALSLARELSSSWLKEKEDSSAFGLTLAVQNITRKLEYLVGSRPTAVNLADAAKKLTDVVRRAQAGDGATRRTVELAYILAAEQMLVDDLRDNQNIGRHGADWIMRQSRGDRKSSQVSVVTHCNTGSLATAGYGTALGVVRSLHAANVLKQAFYCETRPYNQGSRLTGYELIHDDIPATLITDSMAAALFHQKGASENIVAVIVGADRVAANGDTANKIGTYALAILARFHGVKFLVAAPRTTIDLNTLSGESIVIEERSPREMTTVKGPVVVDGIVDSGLVAEVDIAAKGTRAWNPAFDITPAELIDGVVTEVGVVEKGSDGKFDLQKIFDIGETESRADGETKKMPDPREGP